MNIYSLISHIMVFLSLYFEIFFLLTYLSKKKYKTDTSEPFAPPVSIIIPCFNEENSAIKTINSVLNLDYPKENLHIMFIDDGSTDKTFQKVTTAFKDNPQVEIYKKENGGKYTALNLGIEKSKYGFIGSLDADSFVDPKSLKIIMNKFKDETVMATIPSTVIYDPKTIIQKAQRAEYNFSNFIRHVLSLIGSVYVTPGPFSFFRKEVFEQIGVYKHAYHTEDMEIAMRMQEHGLKIAHAEKAIIYTLGPNTAKKLYKQRVRWASGCMGNLKDYRHMLFNRKYGDLSIFVLPFLTVAIVGLIFLSTTSLWRISKDIYLNLERIGIVGFSIGNFNILDWFHLNTGSFAILALCSLLYAMIALSIGNKLTSGKFRFNLEFFYMVGLYFFMYPIWILKATYNTLLSKTAPWR